MSGMTEDEDQRTQDRRPTPVRMAMDAGEARAEETGAPDRSVLDPETGQEWVARISGRSRSGVVPLRIISLMEITFSSVEDPDRPPRRGVCQGEALEELGDAELVRLFRESRPVGDLNRDPPNQERKGRRGRHRRNP